MNQKREKENKVKKTQKLQMIAEKEKRRNAFFLTGTTLKVPLIFVPQPSQRSLGGTLSHRPSPSFLEETFLNSKKKLDRYNE